MRLLLDTHVALWSLVAPRRIPAPVRERIVSPGNEVFVSVAVIWEIAIKHSLGRGDLPAMPSAEAIEAFDAAGYALLDVTARHAAAVETLPLLHGDPFDRLIVAQALAEPMRLVTADRRLAAYSDTVIAWG